MHKNDEPFIENAKENTEFGVLRHLRRVADGEDVPGVNFHRQEANGLREAVLSFLQTLEPEDSAVVLLDDACLLNILTYIQIYIMYWIIYILFYYMLHIYVLLYGIYCIYYMLDPKALLSGRVSVRPGGGRLHLRSTARCSSVPRSPCGFLPWRLG